MSDDTAARADRALEAVLEAEGARDPREFYRERLRELKQADAGAYGKAVEYYKGTLLPDVAGGDVDPLDAWTEYGRILAEALAPGGRTVTVDGTGLAHPYEGPQRDRLVLHLPDKGTRALLVGLPAKLTKAQHATYLVLVEGRQRAS